MMSSRILCSVALVVLVGCSRQPSRTQAASAPGSAHSPVASAEVVPPAAPASTNPAPAGEPVLPPAQTDPAEPRAPSQAPKSITLAAGTHIHVRLGETLDVRRDHSDQPFTATLDRAIVEGNQVVVPKGTRFKGRIVQAKQSGRLKGRAVLALALDSFELHGTEYRIGTSTDRMTSGSHRRRNLELMGGGTAAGASVGAIAGGGVGALVGAGAGAAAGTATALVTGKRHLRLPVETRLTFSLRDSVRVKG